MTIEERSFVAALLWMTAKGGETGPSSRKTLCRDDNVNPKYENHESRCGAIQMKT
jgi:hypothetical protein